MKLLLFNLITPLFFICNLLVNSQNPGFFNRLVNSDNLNFFRKPRFSFFNEFIEPIPGILEDIVSSTSASDPIVDTENGWLRGVKKKSRDGKPYFGFLGIPYAVPPIGDLRFEPPQKLIGRWEGIRNAKHYASTCFHMDVFFSGRMIGEEDCLYANVYTPSIKPKMLMPTLVYLHGGGFSSGSGNMYQEKYFMDESRVVLVIFNYRLSALGFLNTGDGIVRGNQALKDQNLLLRWVQFNIASFGGDPTSITLFGESAGAAMTQYHLLSGQSKGLFHKAILLSGSALSPFALNGNPAASAKRLARSAGCPTLNSKLMVNCLKTVPVHLFKNEYKQMMRTVANPAEYFAPSVETFWNEDTFLKKTPREILHDGDYLKIPLMSGVSSSEGLLYTARLMVDQYAKLNMDQKFASWIPRFLYYDPNNETKTEIIKSFYFPNHKIDLTRSKDFVNLTNLLSDGCFFHPSHEFAKLYASNAPVYLYYNTYEGRVSVFDILRKVPLANFDENDDNSIQSIPEIAVVTELLSDLVRYRLTNKKPSNYGTSHGDTTFLLFNMKNVPGIGRLSMDYSMSKSFIKAVVDFSSIGTNQTLTFDGIPWPTVKPNAGVLPYMQIKLPGQVVQEPFQDRMKMWDEKLKK
ncbi:venom carboxylesterase-6 [Folsomia candida]|uniref:venom carboxylesterase-6 n=1 Tax=Folsomia candida TaxID=158441 RepID=UPI001604A695|nr:venom carboxylesterase-6 [Folsomia candida]